MHALASWFASEMRRGWHCRRGSIGIIAAFSVIPLAIAGGVAIDMSRIAAGRSALQRAVDNAALSGAAAYVLYTQTDSYNATAQNMAGSAFCNAVTALPAGFTLTSSGATACANTPGPAVSAVIAGYTKGIRGITAGSGCTATHTVVAGVVCGFVVTVSASASAATMFPFLLNGTARVSATASAINPFINLAEALSANFKSNANYADSLWVYPLLLDANGSADFTTNGGALPDASACTGNPTQTSCGSYTMLASNMYVAGCTATNPCDDNGTTFINGVVQNPAVGNAVITATTPLGIALESTTGAIAPYHFNAVMPQPKDGCTWPETAWYNTITQEYDSNGYPLVIDSNANWVLPTHWYYSSFLRNNFPPDRNEILAQQTINPKTNQSYATQIVPAVPKLQTNFNPAASKVTPGACSNPTGSGNTETVTTSFPTSGSTNCSLYIVKDPTSLAPDPSYKFPSPAKTPTCFTPTTTPGYQYAALSCQNYAGHNYALFWNDMGGSAYDDTDYGDASLQITCSGPSYVTLID